MTAEHDFWANAEIIRESLAEPCHNRAIRNTAYRVNPSVEADLSYGCVIEVQDKAFAGELKKTLTDFERFMSVSMGVVSSSPNYRIVLSRGLDSECQAEAFEIRVGRSCCELIAVDSAGIRRGLIFLEDQMALKHAPVLPLGTQSRWSAVKDRITRSPIAAYRWKTGWELLDEHDYYPEEYLNKLMHCGINGIWVAGLFRTLIRTEILPELGPASNRLEKLKALVKRASDYGIKVYLFCIEPRFVDAGHQVFDAHPEIRGAIESCLCTSTPVVQEYIRQATCELFSEVPGLGGIINLFNGERITNCWLSEKYAATCPRCREREQVDVLAEDLNCFAEGIRRSGSKGRCLAWTYCMSENSLETQAIDPMLKLMEKVDRDIVWLGNFEHGGKKKICGKEVPIDEYSLSFTGPSKPFEQLARKADQSERTLYAKLQLGTTYELSSVPYLPLPGIVYDKFEAMKTAGVDGTVLSWIPGGFPSVMLKAAGEASFGQAITKDAFLRNLARIDWSEETVDDVLQAWKFFESGMQEYPFTNRLFYFGPITRAPAYPLRLRFETNHAEPYNWGIDRDRMAQPFEEDFERWIAPFTAEEILDQLDKMIDKWGHGLRCLDRALKKSPDTQSEKHYAVAQAGFTHFCCAKNILEFFVCRKALLTAGQDEKKVWVIRMKNILEDQIRRVSDFKPCLVTEPTIGYQSEILDFSYDVTLLDRAVEMNRRTLQILSGPEDQLFRELQQETRPIPEKAYRPNVETDGD